MRSSNPALGENTFQESDHSNPMTMQGTVNKSFLLLFLLMLSSFQTWQWALPYIKSEQTGVISGAITAAAIGGFVVALITIFAKRYAVFFAPLYALIEGVVIGGISAFFENEYPGIVMQASTLTFSIFAALLLAYKTRMIRATENFKLMVFAGTAGVAILYLIDIVLRFFGMEVPYIHETGAIGIGFSVVVVVIASLNLVLDFDFIESGVDNGAPKHMEWYAAFGLLVTLIWLYLELLKLLAKLRSSD